MYGSMYNIEGFIGVSMFKCKFINASLVFCSILWCICVCECVYTTM